MKKSIILLVLFLTHPLFSNVPFSISGTPEATANGPASLEDPSTLSELISQLKQKAVQEWLQGQLGDRYPLFEKSLTPDFCERYVLDYKVGRSGAKRENLDLTGHLDSESLKKWIRLQDTRKGATSVKPVLLFSSNVPNFTFGAAETQDRIGSSTFGQTVSSLLNPLFQKINTKPILADRSAPLSQPAKFDSEIGMLRDYTNQMGGNAAVWVHLQNCPACNGGARIDLIFYSMPSQRIAIAESEDVNLKPQEWGSGEKIKSTLQASFTQFQTGVEGLVTSGQFFAQTMKIVFDGLQNYRIFKALDAELSQSDYASNAYLKKTGPKYAEFEVLSQLTAEDLAQKIQNTEVPGLHLKAQKFDSRTVVVKAGK